MEQIIAALLSFVAVLCIGGAFLINRTYKETLRQRLRTVTPVKAAAEEAPSRLLKLMYWLGGRASGKGPSRQLARDLARAGLSAPNASSIYLGIKLALFLIGLAGFVGLQLLLQLETSQAFLLVGGGTSFLFFLPNYYIKARSGKHTTEIRHHLPDAVDLLEICVSSGMGLDMAWNVVGNEIRQMSPRLADEMALTNLEIHLGVPRADALRHMVNRTGAEELGSLVAVMVQAERFGTSISEVLKIFATNMRELRSQRAEESAEKMSVKMIFPMVLFIFPAIFVVTAGPAVIILLETLINN